MHVIFDTTPLSNQSAVRGIGMYTKHLSLSLAEVRDMKVTTLQGGKLPSDAEILHYPYFDLFFRTLKIDTHLPTVVTVHDITPLHFPELYPVGLRGKWALFLQKRALKKADAIITDSKASRDDILKFLPVSAETIHVVYLAPQTGLISHPNAELLHKVRATYSLPAKFVLYVGDINPNKNIPVLWESCQMLGLPLVIVGKQAATKTEDRDHPEVKDLVFIQQKAKDDPEMVKLLGFVPVEDLSGIFAAACVCVMPSLYEGFGLPILEAMTCGCPVVSTKNGSLPEVGGDAVIYSSDASVDKLAKSISFVVQLSDAQRQRLIHEGRTQAGIFSWERAARETVQVYDWVLRKRAQKART